MPFLDSSEILKAVAKAEGSFASAEFREGSNAAARMLFGNAGSAFSNLQSLKESLEQPTEAILQQRVSDALKTNKEAAHAGDFGDSFAVPVSYIVSSRDFKVSYKLAENNRFGYQEQLQTGIVNAMLDIRESINAYALAQLAAQRTQVAEAGGLLTWDGVGFKYQNATVDLERAASRIKSTARLNKYGDALDVLGGQQLVYDMLHNAAQGTSNDENLQYQFNNIVLAEEETIDEATLGAAGYGYVMPRGTVGMTSWNEPINRSGRGDVNDNEGLFSTIADPVIPGLVYDWHAMRGLSDNAATGKTFYQDPTDEYEVTAIYTFSHAMISVANETPIFAFEQL